MFSAGDKAPFFNLTMHTGKRFLLRNTVGTPLALLFLGHDSPDSNQRVLQAIQNAQPEFDSLQFRIFAITPDSMEQNAELAENLQLSFSLLADPGYVTSRLFEIFDIDPLDDEAVCTFSRTLVLLDKNLTILGIYTPFNEEHIPALLETVRYLCPPEPPVVISDRYTPPILLIPDVIDRGSCRDIINIWETQGNQDSHFMRSRGEKTYGVIDYDVKIRRDHFIRDPNVKSFINGLFRKRVYPEIEKCFNDKVYEYEHFKIACYDSATGGYFRQHRDNTSGGTAHRKWALSLNLNTEEYEGGYLHFPEYGPQLYKPATGSAVVFSCSLMHEATDVTAGKRFTLLSFFYGEKESRERKLYQKTYGTEDYIPKEVRDQLRDQK